MPHRQLGLLRPRAPSTVATHLWRIGLPGATALGGTGPHYFLKAFIQCITLVQVPSKGHAAAAKVYLGMTFAA